MTDEVRDVLIAIQRAAANKLSPVDIETVSVTLMWILILVTIALELESLNASLGVFGRGC